MSLCVPMHNYKKKIVRTSAQLYPVGLGRGSLVAIAEAGCGLAQ